MYRDHPEYSHCRKVGWNSAGASSLMWRDWGIPIVNLLNSTDAKGLINDVRNHNLRLINIPKNCIIYQGFSILKVVYDRIHVCSIFVMFSKANLKKVFLLKFYELSSFFRLPYLLKYRSHSSISRTLTFELKIGTKLF